jgi:glutathione S-transferase
MHSGFLALRDELPFNVRLRACLATDRLSDTCRAQVQRMTSTWSDCRAHYAYEGPGLFGEPCITDIMFAPVVLRFRSYGIPVTGLASEYTEWIVSLRSVIRWTREAEAEEESLAFIDQRTPAEQSPLDLG